ncbi:MAG: dTMP kinase [Bacteroidota bacterium]
MMPAKESLFIVIEGLDGSGKSSAGRAMMDYLELAFPGRIKLTFEPNDSSCGGLYIRQVLTKRITQFRHRTLALAFAANRLDHGDRIIGPALERPGQQMCISDRYYLSSLVYQSMEDFPMDSVMRLNELARQPDLIFFLNVSNEVCLQRMQIRNQPPELFEQNLSATRDKFLKGIEFLRSHRQEQIVEIDGNGSPANTLEQMLTALWERWPEWRNDDLPGLPAFFAQKSVEEVQLAKWQGAFEQYLKTHQYELGDRYEQAGAMLYELSTALSGGPNLQGLGVLLGSSQKVEYLFAQLADCLATADFAMAFFSGPTATAPHFYQRETTSVDGKRKLFPAIRLLTEKDLEKFLPRP